MPNLGGAEWLILIAIIALLFGAKRLPDAARGLGRSMRIFKAETKGLVGGEVTVSAADQEAPAISAAPAAAPPSAEPRLSLSKLLRRKAHPRASFSGS